MPLKTTFNKLGHLHGMASVRLSPGSEPQPSAEIIAFVTSAVSKRVERENPSWIHAEPSGSIDFRGGLLRMSNSLNATNPIQRCSLRVHVEGDTVQMRYEADIWEYVYFCLAAGLAFLLFSAIFYPMNRLVLSFATGPGVAVFFYCYGRLAVQNFLSTLLVRAVA